MRRNRGTRNIFDSMKSHLPSDCIQIRWASPVLDILELGLVLFPATYVHNSNYFHSQCNIECWCPYFYIEVRYSFDNSFSVLVSASNRCWVQSVATGEWHDRVLSWNIVVFDDQSNLKDKYFLLNGTRDITLKLSCHAVTR